MLLPMLWADVFTHFDLALIVSLLLLCVVDGKPLEGVKPLLLTHVIANVAGGKPL